MFLTNPATLAGQWTIPRMPEAMRFTFLAIFGAAMIAVFAQFAVPLWPVPVTGQSLAVLLIGMAYGARLGAFTVLLYVIAGVAGLPVFAKMAAGPQVLMGPTGGYIVGFVLGAALVGWLAERGWSRSFILAVLAQLIGSAVILGLGVAWLARFYAGAGAGRIAATGAETPLGAAIAAGLRPFLVGNLIKAVLAACIVFAAWRLIEMGRR
jgi:biotin transport system substrate-specific component